MRRLICGCGWIYFHEILHTLVSELCTTNNFFIFKLLFSSHFVFRYNYFCTKLFKVFAIFWDHYYFTILFNFIFAIIQTDKAGGIARKLGIERQLPAQLVSALEIRVQEEIDRRLTGDISAEDT